MILLKELPKVVPYPLSSGSTTKRPYLLSSEISAISILGFRIQTRMGPSFWVINWKINSKFTSFHILQLNACVIAGIQFEESFII